MEIGTLLDRIEAKLVAHGVPHEREATRLFVLPASDEGFTVLIFAEGEAFTVYANGWHDDFEDPEEAGRFFLFALTETVRLQEERRGGDAFRWTLEYQEEGTWRSLSTTGLFLVPFWKRREKVTLQNHWLPAEAVAEESQ